MKVQPHANNYCAKCDEIIFSANILRHTTSGKPVEQLIYPEFCPLCGKKLEKFKGFINERMYG